jgi:RimJ/RimL family protein N-acetyltransferase
MKLPPELACGPVRLRRFEPQDAPRLQLLAGEWDIARYTLTIPHPYADGLAETWIASHDELRATGRSHPYVVTRAADGLFIGAASLQPDPANLDSIGYWIGKPFWGQGYATAAMQALLDAGFGHSDRDALTATHLVANPASGRVMEKCGLRFVSEKEVTHREGKLETIRIWRIERREWERRRAA